ncbi:T9SS type A sorting domain-containing protein [bacterium]|nr:T9SS type A sorting domain-containing protein [bacterium]
MRVVDLFIGTEGVVHILSCTRHSGVNNYRFYHSRLDMDGNAIDDAVLLEGLGDLDYFPNDLPYSMVIDSREQVVISGGSNFYINDDTVRTMRVFYQRYNFDGEPVGDMHFLDQNQSGFEYWHSMKMATNDTLTFIWSENDETINSLYYCMVAPNDSVIIDNFNIRADDDWGSVNFTDFETDIENRLVILLWDNRSNLYVRKYDRNMQTLFQTELGEYFYRMGDIYIDKEDNVHVGIGFQTEEGHRYVGYSQVDNEGNLLDSAVVVYGREEIPRGYWTEVKVYTCSDDFTGVLWRDGRFGPYQQEIFLRYKTSQSVNSEFDNYSYPDNPIIYTIYPNPFNSSTTIHYYLPYSSPAKFEIRNILGRLVYSREISGEKGGYHCFKWQGINQKGEILPSGSYLIKLKSQNKQTTEKVLLIR